MKHIKNYKLFEAVIMPNRIENNFIVNSFNTLVDYGEQNNFDVVNYNDFYNSLTPADKRNAPPRYGVPFFALFHPENKRPMFVCVDENAPRFIPNFKEIVDDIIGHEMVHAEQTIRKGDVEYSLPSPTDRKAYFSNKEEIMAFSWTIANGLAKTNRTIEAAMQDLDAPEPVIDPIEFRRGMPGPGGMRGMPGPPPGMRGIPGPPPGGMRGMPGPPPGMPMQRRPEHKMVWDDIKRYSDDDVLKRYRKYIYMYLDKMMTSDENNIHSKINKR